MEERAGFTAGGVAILNRAFSDALAALAINGEDAPSRERLARIVIRAAGEHRTTDVDSLFVQAVKAYRGGGKEDVRGR